MSLKIFHVIFICFSVFLSFAFGVWAFRHALEQDQIGYLAGGAISILAGVALATYGYLFLQKMKEIT